MPYRVFVVEDHPAMCRAYTQMIDATPELESCGVASTGKEALRQIPEIKPDLVLLDISLPDMNGLEVSKRLLAELPDLPVLIVSGHERVLYGDRASGVIGPNIRGYITKDQGPAQLVKAIRWVLAHDGEYLPEK